jgi:hypothetical protein
MKDRAQLWNGVEAFETRKNSQLARELEVSIPHELTPEQRKQAIRSFVDSELVARGMVADVAYHDFTGKHRHNPHAHILVTMREIDGETFSKKKNREWNSEETLVNWREAWARHANHALEQAKLQTRIDHRNHKDRGITTEPLSESRGEWHQRQRDIAATKKQLDAVKQEMAALEQEQKQEWQEHLDGIIQVGNDLARKRALQEQQAQLAKTAIEAFELGKKLAREQQQSQQQKPTPEPTQPTSAPERNSATPKRDLKPWQREWEKAHQAAEERREQRQKQRDRQERIQQAETAREKQRPTPQPSRPTEVDERQFIEQWRQFHDRERDKPRPDGDKHYGAEPGRGISPEQQTAKLTEEMAAFEAEDVKQHPSKRRKPVPKPQKEQEHKPEQHHERGRGR